MHVNCSLAPQCGSSLFGHLGILGIIPGLGSIQPTSIVAVVLALLHHPFQFVCCIDVHGQLLWGLEYVGGAG